MEVKDKRIERLITSSHTSTLSTHSLTHSLTQSLTHTPRGSHPSVSCCSTHSYCFFFVLSCLVLSCLVLLLCYYIQYCVCTPSSTVSTVLSLSVSHFHVYTHILYSPRPLKFKCLICLTCSYPERHDDGMAFSWMLLLMSSYCCGDCCHCYYSFPFLYELSRVGRVSEYLPTFPMLLLYSHTIPVPSSLSTLPTHTRTPIPPIPPSYGCRQSSSSSFVEESSLSSPLSTHHPPMPPVTHTSFFVLALLPLQVQYYNLHRIAAVLLPLSPGPDPPAHYTLVSFSFSHHLIKYVPCIPSD